MQILMAARARGVQAIDGPFLQVRDVPAFLPLHPHADPDGRPRPRRAGHRRALPAGPRRAGLPGGRQALGDAGLRRQVGAAPGPDRRRERDLRALPGGLRPRRAHPGRLRVGHQRGRRQEGLGDAGRGDDRRGQPQDVPLHPHADPDGRPRPRRAGHRRALPAGPRRAGLRGGRQALGDARLRRQVGPAPGPDRRRQRDLRALPGRLRPRRADPGRLRVGHQRGRRQEGLGDAGRGDDRRGQPQDGPGHRRQGRKMALVIAGKGGVVGHQRGRRQEGLGDAGRGDDRRGQPQDGPGHRRQGPRCGAATHHLVRSAAGLSEAPPLRPLRDEDDRAPAQHEASRCLVVGGGRRRRHVQAQRSQPAEPRVHRLHGDGGGEHVALVHGSRVVAGVPAGDGEHAGDGLREVVQGDADRVPAVDQSRASRRGGVVVDPREVAGQARQFGRAGDQVCTEHVPRPAHRPRARGAGRPRPDVPGRHGAEEIRGPRQVRGRRELVDVPGGGGVGGTQQHGAPAVVQHCPPELVGRGDPQQRQSGRGAAGTAAVLPQRLHGGRGVQRVAQQRLAGEQQAAVGQVGPDVLGGQGRLSDGDVADQSRAGERSARHPRRQLVVQCQREAVAHHGGVLGLQSAGEGHPGCRVEDLPHPELVEERTSDTLWSAGVTWHCCCSHDYCQTIWDMHFGVKSGHPSAGAKVENTAWREVRDPGGDDDRS
ncbi:hypothetical protein [Modestobacter sp. Leaf380]|uniref:hypothetical protein n=1 Tax=Modestobacter sp. Leaf380 TaxID=1736356 RepID=UPI00350FF707